MAVLPKREVFPHGFLCSNPGLPGASSARAEWPRDCNDNKHNMNISVSELIVRYLERLGIDHIFGMPGAHVLPIYDCLHDSTVKSVLVKHEPVSYTHLTLPTNREV